MRCVGFTVSLPKIIENKASANCRTLQHSLLICDSPSPGLFASPHPRRPMVRLNFRTDGSGPPKCLVALDGPIKTGTDALSDIGIDGKDEESEDHLSTLGRIKYEYQRPSGLGLSYTKPALALAKKQCRGTLAPNRPTKISPTATIRPKTDKHDAAPDSQNSPLLSSHPHSPSEPHTFA